MFTGHAGLALLAKRARPSIPLWLLLGAAYASDGAELVLNLLRVPDERVVAMISHSLLGDAIGATLLGLAYWAVRRDGVGAAILGATLLSHWPADFLTGHGKPTWPGGPDLGLFLYRYNAFDFLMETAVLLTAWALLRQLPGEALAPRGSWPGRALARGARLLPLLLLPVQLAYNIVGHLGYWDWKAVMLRGSRAGARAVRDGVSTLVPPSRGAERHATGAPPTTSS